MVVIHATKKPLDIPVNTSSSSALVVPIDPTGRLVSTRQYKRPEDLSVLANYLKNRISVEGRLRPNGTLPIAHVFFTEADEGGRQVLFPVQTLHAPNYDLFTENRVATSRILNKAKSTGVSQVRMGLIASGEQWGLGYAGMFDAIQHWDKRIVNGTDITIHVPSDRVDQIAPLALSYGHSLRRTE